MTLIDGLIYMFWKGEMTKDTEHLSSVIQVC